MYHYTADYLKKLGYEVICLDFKNPEKSTRYNLLQPVIDAINEDDVERAEMYAWDITNILVIMAAVPALWGGSGVFELR